MGARLLRLVVLLASAAASLPASAAAQDAGLTLRFMRADADMDLVREVLESEGRFPEVIEALNEALEMPVGVAVLFAEGDGPLYDPSRRVIVMNYEFIAWLAGLFDQYDPDASPEEHLTSVLDATEFIFFHEVGHALIDVLGLPVVGREEDAVDSLATVLMVEFMEEPEAALSAAISFDSFAAVDDGEIGDADLWGEHSLDEQRFWAITCWVYGSDPEAFADLVGDDWLPKERAAACPQEYEQQADGWDRLLRSAEDR